MLLFQTRFHVAGLLRWLVSLTEEALDELKKPALLREEEEELHVVSSA